MGGGKRKATGFIITRTFPVGDNINQANVDRSYGAEYLLLQTSYGDNHWTPPKGHVDPGETDMGTAYRETQEEAGIEKDSLMVHEDMSCELKYEYMWEGEVCYKVTLYWLAEVKDHDVAVIISDEHQAYRWCDLETACQLVVYPDMQKALRDCHKYIEKHAK